MTAPEACLTPRGSWGTCIQALAAGWILPGDLCPTCTEAFTAALDGIAGPLKWCPAYIHRAETEETTS